MTTDYLGIAGDSVNAKLFLGDSAGYGDATLGMYGTLAERKAIAEKLAVIQAVGGASSGSDIKPGSGTYTRPTNRPINIR